MSPSINKSELAVCYVVKSIFETVEIFENLQYTTAAWNQSSSGGTCWGHTVVLYWHLLKALRPLPSTVISIVNLWRTLLIHSRQTQSHPLKEKSLKRLEDGGEREEVYNPYLSMLICLQAAESFNFYIQKP